MCHIILFGIQSHFIVNLKVQYQQNEEIIKHLCTIRLVFLQKNQICYSPFKAEVCTVF